MTPLHYAAAKGQLDVIELLLKHGADVNARDKNGYTPLHAAAYYDHADAAGLLIVRGADARVRNNEGKTPLDVARERGRAEVARAIEEYSGKRAGERARWPWASRGARRS